MSESVKNQYKLNVKPPRILSLIVLSAFAAMGVAVITPALPNIVSYFHVSIGVAQLTVTSFLLGYSLGQLIYGPIANRLGRKPAFYIGIAIATLGSLLSIFSSPIDSFFLMVLGRFLEALGASVGLVICFTIINDFYYPDQARPVLGFMTLAFALVPGMAVTFGGLITEYLQWQACFYALLAYGLFLIIPAATLPETITQYDPHALKGPYLVKNYMLMFKNRRLMAYALIYGLTAACAYVFSAEGPIIGIHTLGYRPGVYGMIGLIPYMGAMLGAVIMIQHSAKLDLHRIVTWGIVLEAFAAILMFLCFITGLVNIFTLILPTFLLMIGHAFLVATCTNLAIAQSEDKANASAVVSFVGVGMAVIFTLVLGMLHSYHALILPIMLCLAIFMMFLIRFFIRP